MDKNNISRSGELLKVTFSGELTIEYIKNIRGILDAESSSENVQAIMADLSKVRFIDSTGIGFLVSINSRMKDMEKKFYLLRPSEQVCKTLELVRLISFFTIINDESEAAAQAD